MREMELNNLIECLANGDVLRLPTDTVYGYICDASNKGAVAKVYEMKKRDEKKPLGIFVSDINEFYKIIDGGRESLKDNIREIIEKNWPGALTVICKKSCDYNILQDFNDGLDTIGVRIPKDEALLTILKKYGKPLAETSANISGEKDVPSVNGAKASTIIDITNGNIKVVREGNIKINI